MPNSKTSARKKADKNTKIERGSGNVFIDLGFTPEEAANLTLRSQLMLVLKDTIKERGWTQQRAAKELSIHQPRVSDLTNGRLSEFSLDALVCLVQKLGYEVELRLKETEVA
jgi:predicted XRE-type DNA-binding protein